MMRRIGIFILPLAVFLMPISCSAKTKKYPVIELITSEGTMYIWLYDDTPLHKQNFIKLAKEGFYDKTKFHRVIKDFMIQGGDPNSKDEKLKDEWGQGGPGYTIPSEISSKHYHKKGVLAAARIGDQMNPNRESSGSQFYIVQGLKFNELSLGYVEQQIALATKNPGFKFNEEMRKDYVNFGGTPQLDMQYTVFGEVIKGLEVVDKIAAVQTGPQDQPLNAVEMDVNVLELTAKQFKKKFGFKVPGTAKK